MATYDVSRKRHLSSLLPVPYHKVPAKLRFALSRILLGGGESAAAVDFAVAYANDHQPWRAPWQERQAGACAALSLTHDVDTGRGFDQIQAVVDVEGELGMRSTVFVVGELLERLAPRLADIRAQGWEIGLHGLVHDNRLPSLEGAALERRVHAICDLARALDLGGFRAPSLWIREQNIEAVARAFRYDSSVPSFRAASRLAPQRGAYSCRPFGVGATWEIPVSLPLDDDLARAGLNGRVRFDEIDRWIDAVVERAGVAVYLDHLEPHLSGNPKARDAYRSWLARVSKDPRLWIAPMCDVAAALGAPRIAAAAAQ